MTSLVRKKLIKPFDANRGNGLNGLVAPIIRRLSCPMRKDSITPLLVQELTRDLRVLVHHTRNGTSDTNAG